ncbi:hypothetical protein M1403_02575 [Patescibacteria group bacterium]|nr:hypothetical protein [Patescibacteria group bacterium]
MTENHCLPSLIHMTDNEENPAWANARNLYYVTFDHDGRPLQEIALSFPRERSLICEGCSVRVNDHKNYVPLPNGLMGFCEPVETNERQCKRRLILTVNPRADEQPCLIPCVKPTAVFDWREYHDWFNSYSKKQ